MVRVRDPVIHPTIKRASAEIISSDLYREETVEGGQNIGGRDSIGGNRIAGGRLPRVQPQPRGDPAGRCIFPSPVTPSRRERVEQVMPVGRAALAALSVQLSRQRRRDATFGHGCLAYCRHVPSSGTRPTPVAPRISYLSCRGSTRGQAR